MKENNEKRYMRLTDVIAFVEEQNNQNMSGSHVYKYHGVAICDKDLLFPNSRTKRREEYHEIVDILAERLEDVELEDGVYYKFIKNGNATDVTLTRKQCIIKTPDERQHVVEDEWLEMMKEYLPCYYVYATVQNRVEKAIGIDRICEQMVDDNDGLDLHHNLVVAVKKSGKRTYQDLCKEFFGEKKEKEDESQDGLGDR